MAQNPLGAVQASDFGNPKILNGTAMAVLSGGYIVGVSGATAVVGSGLDSYVTSDIHFFEADDAENCVGVVLQTTASGAACPVAVDGAFLLGCFGSVFAGRLVKGGTTSQVANLGSRVVPANAQDSAIAGDIFGRALTAGASGGFALIYVHS